MNILCEFFQFKCADIEFVKDQNEDFSLVKTKPFVN